MCETILILVVLVVEIEVEVPAVGYVGGEFAQFAALALGGTSESLPSVDESGYLHNFEQVELALRSYIFHVLRHQSGPESVFGKRQNAEGVCHRWLAHINHIAHLYGSRGFDWRRIVDTYAYTAFFAGFGSYGAGLEHAHGP